MPLSFWTLNGQEKKKHPKAFKIKITKKLLWLRSFCNSTGNKNKRSGLDFYICCQNIDILRCCSFTLLVSQFPRSSLLFNTVVFYWSVLNFINLPQGTAARKHLEEAWGSSESKRESWCTSVLWGRPTSSSHWVENALSKGDCAKATQIPGSFYTCSCENKMFIVAHFQQQSMTWLTESRERRFRNVRVAWT